MRDRILENHLTSIGGLKPRNIVQAAEEDFKRKVHNKIADRTDLQHYAFHRKHVKKAKSVAQLLTLALAESELGCASGKSNTRLIYRDLPTLQAAYDICGGYDGKNESTS